MVRLTTVTNELLDGPLSDGVGFLELVISAAEGIIPAPSNAVGVMSRKTVGNRFALRVWPCIQRPLPTVVVVGKTQFAMVVIADLNGRPDTSSITSLLGLSPRQAEAASLFTSGLGNAEIAEKMGMSSETVANDLRHVCSRVGCGNMSDMVRKLARVP
jgi:DNA-binding CsgD family transcriptional regulator